MTDSQALLAEYVKNGSETAFEDLVSRYIDLVFSTALRLVRGDTHLAQDVTQTVFIHLARKARQLGEGVMLGGWLHRDACYTAATILRTEQRRQGRERRAMEMTDHRPENAFDEVAPVLDEAINGLAPEDRTAILLRFYERRDFRSVGAALGSSEDAARMRVSRALEKLHSFLKHRGVSLSVAALGMALAEEAVTAAPAGLAASVAGAALAGSATGAGISATVIKVITMTKIKAILISGVLVAGVATPLVLQQQAQNRLRVENDSLRDQIGRLGQLEEDNARLSNLVGQANAALPEDQLGELLRLRGEVGSLKRQLGEAAQAEARLKQQEKQQAKDTAEREEAIKQMMIARMNSAKGWILAFHLYAGQNQGRLPQSLDEAAPYVPQELKAQTLSASNQFEILCRSPLNTITNPASIILLRETETHQSADDGSWFRTYGFADGHSEVHKAVNGDFIPWEQQHMIMAK